MTQPLPDYEQALASALTAATPIGRTERVALDASLGRVLAEAVAADRDLPPFNRAQMDGFALRADEVGRQASWPVVRTIAAGCEAGDEVPNGGCAAVATGAPLPPGVDTVIQHELSNRENPVRFTVDSIDRGHAVHPKGADARAGDIVIENGTRLRPHHLGIAASVGVVALEVIARPRVVVLTSGDEVVPVGEQPLPHQIRNSNSIMLRGLLERIGADVIRAAHIPDEPTATNDAVRAAIDEADVLCTVGGISAGERDYFPAAFDACSVELSLGGAAIQPGKPVRVGRAPNGAVIIALPGNPVSVLACACLFAWPIVRSLSGLNPSLSWRKVTLADPVRPNPRRRAFRPAILVDENHARVPTWAGSGDLVHTTKTDGLVELPVQEAPVDAGVQLRFLPWP